LLTVTVTILPMRCNVAYQSGTVLWSVLLLGSSETEITHFVLGAKEGACHA